MSENDVKKPEDTDWAEPIRRFSRKHKVVFAIAFLALVLVVSQIPHVVFGATPARPHASSPSVFQPHICRPSGTPDEVCLWSVATEVAKFRSGYFDHKSGFSPNFVFAEPAKAKETIVDHITTKLTNQGTPLPASCNGSERCYAYKLYAGIVSDASCVTKGVPTNEANTCARTPESDITQDGINNGISVVLCGTIVAVGIFKKLTSKFLAGAGGTECVWNLYRNATE